MRKIYASLEERDVLDPTEHDWEPARAFFEARQAGPDHPGSSDAWKGWNAELQMDVSGNGAGSSQSAVGTSSNPTVHLPHLLQILGPSSLTLYKHVLGRRRIMIYTQPPVEAACVLCQVAADLCFEEQVPPPPEASLSPDDPESRRRLKGKSKEGIKVLGMVTLSDLEKLDAESKIGRGWIACTTDAIFLEKPSYYDLLIDLTTVPSKASRPTLSSSKTFEQFNGTGRKIHHRLSTVRFTWSDVKLVRLAIL